MFEDVACMIYDMVDHKRQWQNYVKNLKLQHVPVFGDVSSISQMPGTFYVILFPHKCKLQM